MLSVSVSGIGVTRPNLHFFQYLQAYKPYADPVPQNTEQYQFILIQYHQVPAIIALYCQVYADTTYNSSRCKTKLNNFSFHDSFDESRTVYLV